MLRRFGLACVVINRNYEVLHFAGPTEDYLVQPGGPPTQNLLSLARKALEPKLRVVIRRAIRENAAQSIKGVMMRHEGDIRRVNIEVEPLNASKQTAGLLLISFQEQPNPSGETLAEARTRAETAEPDLLRQLEQELETTRDDLQSTIEEMESANEELKASNEEVMSMNEELQSANEELETSKEELQSLNEELSTVNNQLHDKVEEVESASNDMANLFNATHIATVFLDAGLRIKLFTPPATRMFNLIATDRRPADRRHRHEFTDDDLLREAQELLRDLTPREKEVRTEDGRWCIRRIMPYRTLDNRIDGVVITFVDITERKAGRGRGRPAPRRRGREFRGRDLQQGSRRDHQNLEPRRRAALRVQPRRGRGPIGQDARPGRPRRRMDQGHGHAGARRACRAARDGAYPQGRTASSRWR